MGDTRTYEDFAGMLGRRVARVKEACGGAVARHQPGGAVNDKHPSDGWHNPFEEEFKPKPEEIERFYSYLPDYVDYVVEQHNAGKDNSDFGTRYGEWYDRLKAYENGENDRLGGKQRRARKKERKWLGSELKEMSDSIKSNPNYMYDVIREQAKRGMYGAYPSGPGSLWQDIYDENNTGGQMGIHRNGGKIRNIMRYTVYFRNGGLLPRSQRRVYQTGGKASAQDTMQQLYQLTQVAMNGSGQEQQQAMQALGQFVGEAMNGNQQYAQIIQAVFDGAKKGSREMTQMAQVFQSIMQQMQKREFGGRLDYITMLRNGGRPRYQPGGEMSRKERRRTRGLYETEDGSRQRMRRRYRDEDLAEQLDRILQSGDVDFNNHVPNGYWYDVDNEGNPYYIAPDGHEIYPASKRRYQTGGGSRIESFDPNVLSDKEKVEWMRALIPLTSHTRYNSPEDYEYFAEGFKNKYGEVPTFDSMTPIEYIMDKTGMSQDEIRRMLRKANKGHYDEDVTFRSLLYK